MSNFKYFLLFLAFLFIFSRGIFEIYFDKVNSYILSLILFIFFFSLHAMLMKVKYIFSRKLIMYSIPLFLVSFISLLVTLIYTNHFLWVYLIYIMFFISLLIISDSMIFTYSSLKINQIFTILLIILILASLLQSFEVINLPGQSLYKTNIRPSSLTGSYLHYPLLLYLLFTLPYILKSKKKYSEILIYPSIILTYSRSLYLMTIIFLTMYHCIAKKNISFVIFLTVFFVVFLIIIYPDPIIRLIQTFDTSDISISGKIDRYIQAGSLYIKTNLLFGEYFGLFGNISKNMSNINSTALESSVSQILISTGLISLFLYILTFRYIYLTSSQIFKIVLVPVFAHSLIYQSVEVMPYIILLFYLYSLDKNYMRSN